MGRTALGRAPFAVKRRAASLEQLMMMQRGGHAVGYGNNVVLT